ncbi:hypothetical protein MK489_12575 [Myxococcota bacterium]|nr:hypothetical protein [Myxococcota bacterium]
MTGAFSFVVGNALALAAAVGLASWAFSGREHWRRAFGALAAYPLICMAAVALASLSGDLSGMGPMWTAGAMAGGVALAHLAKKRTRPGTDRWPLPEPTSQGAHSEPGNPAQRAALGLAGGLLAAWAFTTLLLGTQFVWDDLSYHAALPARWLANGQLGLAPLTFQAYYPLNPEVFALWFLAPLGSDAYASAGVFYWGVLASASVALLARGIAGPGVAPPLCIAFLLTSNVVWNRSHTFTATDLAATASLLAGIVFAMSKLGTSREQTRVDALAAGALCGLAVGSKVFYAPAAAVVALGLAARVGESRPRAGLGAVGWFGLAALLTGGAWYLRNWTLTGNPLFPASFGPFGGPFDATAQAQTTLAARISNSGIDLANWRDLLVSRANWPPSLAAISALGALGAAVSLSRESIRKSLSSVEGILLLAGAVTLVAYPLLPFSGTGNRPDMPPHTGYLRFLLLPFAAGIVLFSRRVSGNSHRSGVWTAVGLLAVATAWKLPALESVVVFVTGLVLVTLRQPLLRVWSSLQSSAWRMGVAGITVLVGLAAWAPVKQHLTDERLFDYRAHHGPIGQAWRALETLPDGSRIAFFMAEPSEYTQIYPLFGRRLQHVPVMVDRDGSPRKPLHERWREIANWWEEWDTRSERLDTRALLHNLRGREVDYVLVSRWSLDEWPPQHEALKAAPLGEPLFDDGYSVLWNLNP